MAFSAVDPIPALTSAASNKTADELRAYAAGIIAHIAIQTMYRIEHLGNYIITERSIWVGDTKTSTISKILDPVDRIGIRNLIKAVPKAANGPKPKLAGTPSKDLLVALTYLIDLSTNESTASKVVRKRYDIVDFGPIAISPVSPGRFGEAYEIKSEGGKKIGKDYITRQVSNYNQTLSKLKDLLEQALNVSGLGGYRLRLGQSWPRTPEILIVGPNILSFWMESPGLIVYRWLSFKRLSWKQLWEYVRRVEADIRKAFETRSSLKPEVVIILLLVTVVAAFILAVLALAVAAGGVEVLAGADVAVARLAQNGALTGGLSAASAAAAPSQSTPSGPATDDSAQQATKVNELLAAFEKMDELDLSFLAKLTSRPSAPTQENLPGGTPQTPGEQAFYKLVDTLVNETVFLYSVQVGQGDEFLSEYNLGILKENLTLWIGSFVSAYGLENLLALTGQNKSAELNEETALKIAEVIVTAARGNLEITRYGRFLADMFSLSAEDVDESLPQGANEDGE
jgi:hypothetical protein